MYIKFSEYIREYVGDLYPTKGTLFTTPRLPELRDFQHDELFDFVNYIANEFGEELLSIEKAGKYMDPFIGSGDYGSVFLLKSGKVLKITSDRSEIRVIVRLVKKFTKYLINFYDVRELVDDYRSLKIKKGGYNITGIYAIIMDKVEPITGKEKQICYYVDELFEKLPNDYKMTNSFKEEFIENTGIGYDDEMKDILDRIWLNLVGMIRELRKLKISDPDFNGGINFGKKDDGTIVHIDVRDTEGRDKSLPDLGYTIDNIKEIDISPILKELKLRKNQD